MSFHDTYTVTRGDTLTKIGKRYGYDNPGPIVAYPPNAERFRGKSPDLIYPQERFLIPWHPSLLWKYIATTKYLIESVQRGAAGDLQDLQRSKEKLDEFLMKIDAVNFLSNTFVGIGSLAVQGMKGVEMSSGQALRWLLDSRVAIAADMATMGISDPTVPKRDFRFYLRHALGPWNPSYWASVWAAVKERKLDIYLYGSNAIIYEQAASIRRQAENDIAKLHRRLVEAESQVSQKFYMSRI